MADDQTTDLRYTHANVQTRITYTVTGAPDTTGSDDRRALTVRPEEVTFTVEDGAVTYIAVRGRTVRGDGEITRYRTAGWTYGPSFQDPPPPPWVLTIMATEGLCGPHDTQETTRAVR